MTSVKALLVKDGRKDGRGDVAAPGRRTEVVCPTCRAPYRPGLTGWTCPVCDTAAPGAERRVSRRFEDADDRLLAIVLVATIANVLLLALLSVFVVKG